MSPFMIDLMPKLIAELIGTALLILLGNGVVANCVLKDTKANGGNWMVITTAWAFAVFVGVVVAGPISGAHLNPAVSLGLAIAGKFAWVNVIPYIIAQVLGAMIGSSLVYLFYIDHFKATEEPALRRACFSTEPAIRNIKVNYLNEIIGTFVLMFVIYYITEGNIKFPGDVEATTPIGLGSIGALPVAILVWVIGLSLGGTTGYAINPARDTGPRLVLTMLSSKLKTNPDWAYGWVPMTAPLIGAAIAGGFFLLLTN